MIDIICSRTAKNTAIMAGWVSLMLLFSAATAFGQTYYVTPQGRETNDGLAWQTAWTLRKAARSVRPGDTVIVRKGKYTDDSNNVFAPITGGTAASPITLRGEDPQNPPSIERSRGGGFTIRVPYIIIQDIGCRGRPGASCVSIRDTHHVTVKRLHAVGNYEGVTIWNSDDNIVMDSVITHNQQGVYASHGSDRNKILRNNVMYNGLGPKGDRDGIAVGGNGAGTDNIIEGNIVAHNGQIGIGVFDAPRTIVKNNHVYNNGSTGISVAMHSVNSIVDGNRVEGNGTTCRSAKNIAGITVRTGSSGTVLSNNQVLNNCVAAGNPWGDKDPRGGIDLRSWRFGDPRTMDNVKLLNNQVSGTVNGPDFYVDPKANIRGLQAHWPDKKLQTKGNGGFMQPTP